MFICQKLLKQCHMDDVMDSVFFIVCEIYFLFEGSIKCAEKTWKFHSANLESRNLWCLFDNVITCSIMIVIGHISNFICITELPNKSRVTCTQFNRLYWVIYCLFIPTFFLLGFTGLFIVYSYPFFTVRTITQCKFHSEPHTSKAIYPQIWSHTSLLFKQALINIAHIHLH